MSTNDKPNDGNFSEYALLKTEKAAIGDIILIGSEIDHLISIALFKTAEIHADIGFSLFGRTSLGTKLLKLRSLLKAEGSDQYRAFEEIKENLDRFIACRNMFAHGVYMGVNEGLLSYMVTADPGQEQDEIIFTIKRFGFGDFGPCVRTGREVVLNLQTIFLISSLRGAFPYRLSEKKSRNRQPQRKSSPPEPT